MTTDVKVPKVSTYTTGLCQVGGHEGAPQLSPGGALRKPCLGEYDFQRGTKVRCMCWCHEMFREVRAMKASLEPQEVDAAGNALVLDDTGWETITPATVVQEIGPAIEAATGRQLLRLPPASFIFHDGGPVVELWAGGYAILEELASSEHLTDYLDLFMRKHDLVKGPKVPHKRYASNDTERRARGSLDINVEAVCRLASLGFCPWDDATPTNISLMVDPLDQPSAGAVREVLIRWGKAGVAEVTDKPVLFVKFIGLAQNRSIAGATAPRFV